MTAKQFPAVSVSVDNDQIRVIRVEVSNVVETNKTSDTLSKELMDAAGFFHDGDSTTVWVDVVAKQIPSYLDKALKGLSSVGVGLVVTHCGACSHGPGPLLSSELRRRVAGVSRAGRVWHPLVKSLVAASPE